MGIIRNRSTNTTKKNVYNQPKKISASSCFRDFVPVDKSSMKVQLMFFVAILVLSAVRARKTEKEGTELSQLVPSPIGKEQAKDKRIRRSCKGWKKKCSSNAECCWPYKCWADLFAKRCQ